MSALAAIGTTDLPLIRVIPASDLGQTFPGMSVSAHGPHLTAYRALFGDTAHVAHQALQAQVRRHVERCHAIEVAVGAALASAEQDQPDVMTNWLAHFANLTGAETAHQALALKAVGDCPIMQELWGEAHGAMNQVATAAGMLTFGATPSLLKLCLGAAAQRDHVVDGMPIRVGSTRVDLAKRFLARLTAEGLVVEAVEGGLRIYSAERVIPRASRALRHLPVSPFPGDNLAIHVILAMLNWTLEAAAFGTLVRFHEPSQTLPFNLADSLEQHNPYTVGQV